MTDTSGRDPMPGARGRDEPRPDDLRSMAEDVARAMGGFHPGRPAFSALSRAHDALKQAAREVEHARLTYAPRRQAPGPGTPSRDAR